MSLGRRWEMVDRKHPKMPIVRQAVCAAGRELFQSLQPSQWQ